MKKYLPLYLLIFCMSYGCATQKAERGVVNNVFSSSYPEIEIKVDERFNYLGHSEYERKSKSLGSAPRTLKSNVHSYIFAIAEGNNIKKAITIDIKRTETFWAANLYGTVKDKLEGGTRKLGGETYQYYTKVITTAAGAPKTRYVLEKGYILPNFILLRGFGKPLKRRDTLFAITYFEDFSDYGDDPAAWKDATSLTSDQRKALENFDANCMNAFKVLK